MEDNPQESLQLSFEPIVEDITYCLELITHRDGRHHIYLDGVDTWCFIERNIGESVMWSTKGLDDLGNFVDHLRAGKSSFNNKVVKSIFKKYAAEYYV